jgi:hypothetical protein
MLAGCPYTVRSRVSVDEFRLFISLLCDEFRFINLSERISVLLQSDNFKDVMVMKDSEAQLRLPSSVFQRWSNGASARTRLFIASASDQSSVSNTGINRSGSLGCSVSEWIMADHSAVRGRTTEADVTVAAQIT